MPAGPPGSSGGGRGPPARDLLPPAATAPAEDRLCEGLAHAEDAGGHGLEARWPPGHLASRSRRWSPLACRCWQRLGLPGALPLPAPVPEKAAAEAATPHTRRGGPVRAGTSFGGPERAE